MTCLGRGFYVLICQFGFEYFQPRTPIFLNKDFNGVTIQICKLTGFSQI